MIFYLEYMYFSKNFIFKTLHTNPDWFEMGAGLISIITWNDLKEDIVTYTDNFSMY